MSTLKLKMSQQMVLAETLGFALAELENRVAQAEEKNLTASLLHNKTKYFDLYGAVDAIAQSMYQTGESFAIRFTADITQAQAQRYAELRGDLVNA